MEKKISITGINGTFETKKLVYFRKFNRNTKAESLHFCPTFVYTLVGRRRVNLGRLKNNLANHCFVLFLCIHLLYN